MLRDHSEPPSKRWDFTFDDLKYTLAYMDWGLYWQDAKLQSVCRYLRGSKYLKVPTEIKILLPIHI